jgi:hypothetical protein
MSDLNSLIPSSGWNLQIAYGINDSGQIAGSGVNPQGSSDAFLLTPIPGPTSIGQAAAASGTTDIGSTGATVTPSRDFVGDVITETGGNGNDTYDAVHIHFPGNGVAAPSFQYTGFASGDTVAMLLKFSNLSTGTDPVPGNPTLLADIEAYINANDGGSLAPGVPTAAAAAAFPGMTYDLEVTATAGSNDPFANFNFSGFTDSTFPTGGLGVSDIGVIPEPASFGILVVGGIWRLVVARKTKESNSFRLGPVSERCQE